MPNRSAEPPWRRRSASRVAKFVAMLLAGLVLPAWLAVPGALAREGVYAGVGVARQTFSDDIKGTEVYTNAPVGNNEVHVGKPDPATGVVLNGGVGFNDYVGLDFVLTTSSHDTTYDPQGPSPQAFDATLHTVLLGLRLGAPLGDVAEVFGRAGVGGYELQYRGNNLDGGQPVDDARFAGRGVALGGGAEVFFGRWGLQLAYTLHDVNFSSLNTLNFSGEAKPALTPTIQSVSLLLNYHLN